MVWESNAGEWGTAPSPQSAQRRQRFSPPYESAWGTPSGASQAGPSQDYSGDPWLRTIQNMLMQNTAARTAGARGAAMRASPNDPSMAAWAGLEGQLRGQSDASGQMAQATNSWLGQRDMQAFEEKMLRLRAQFEQEIARKQAQAAMWSGIGNATGQMGSAAIGAWGGG
jgi:hypothetical protein